MIVLFNATQPLSSAIVLPSDKSIAHRRLLLAACIEGKTTIVLNNPGEDILSTIRALQTLGIEIEWTKSSDTTLSVVVHGRKEWQPPTRPIDCGNSGTTCRLLMGLLAGKQISCELTGDESLRSRPMERVAEPLRQMGAEIRTTGGKLPVTIVAKPLHGISYQIPIASAQLKSALLFAGLFADGGTKIIEPIPTRDHTEKLLQLQSSIENSNLIWSVSHKTPLEIPDGLVPGDPSAASYWVALALSLSGSEIVLKNVAFNPTRIAYLTLLRNQGANIHLEETGTNGGEPFGKIFVKSGGAFSFDLQAKDVPVLIDEIPTLAVLSTMTGGQFHLHGANELRVKETDRISAMVTGLRAMGMEVSEYPDGFSFASSGRLNGAVIDCQNDHRIAMCFAIAALKASGETTLQNAKQAVNISYPGFFEELNRFTGAVQ